MANLSGKVAGVTGGSKGIGAAIAEKLAAVKLFLASNESAWITGQVFPVAGGLR